MTTIKSITVKIGRKANDNNYGAYSAEYMETVELDEDDQDDVPAIRKDLRNRLRKQVTLAIKQLEAEYHHTK